MTEIESKLSLYTTLSPDGSAYEFKSPTCGDFEPNFQKLFRFARNGTIFDSGKIEDSAGVFIGEVKQEMVYGFRQLGKSSNSAVVTVLEKGPRQKDEYKQNNQTRHLVGWNNALLVYSDMEVGKIYTLAVGIGKEGMYINRPVLPWYHEEFIEGFLQLMTRPRKPRNQLTRRPERSITQQVLQSARPVQIYLGD